MFFNSIIKNKINKFSKEYDNPLKIAKLCVKICDGILRAIGINVASDCRVYWFSFSSAFLISQHIILTFYTIYYYWDKNKLSSLQPVAISAIYTPVSGVF